MGIPDLNLLVCLDALLDEGSVAGAARKMGLSGPAMSRTLGRIRTVVGDPILVKVGRVMVPTPRAIALRSDVRSTVQAAKGLLQKQVKFDPATVQRTFTIRTGDWFLGAYGNSLLSRIKTEAPNVTLVFSPESDLQDESMDDQRTDLYIRAKSEMAADMHRQVLFTTRFVGLVRNNHPLLRKEVTPRRFASFEHVSVSRRGRASGPIDRQLATMGLKRNVSLVVPTFHSAVFAACASDLVVTLPENMVQSMRATGLAVATFDLPLPLENVVINQGWHPRFQSEEAHQWLRRMIRDVCSL